MQHAALVYEPHYRRLEETQIEACSEGDTEVRGNSLPLVAVPAAPLGIVAAVAVPPLVA